MTREQLLEILNQGVGTWNAWREGHRDAEIDLRGANLEKANLKNVNMSRANLSGANLSFAQLEDADLTNANMKGANLSHAQLRKAHLAFAHLERAVLLFANLRGADLRGANLRHASLEDAHLQNANLSDTILENAILAYANLKRVDLVNANLEGANMKAVNLEGANVSSVVYDQKVFLKLLKKTGLSPGELWRRRHDMILDTTARCSGVYAACYGSQKFKTFVQDQDFLEEMLETSFGSFLCFVWWLFSNCGRSITRWAIWSFFFILVFAFIFLFMGPHHFHMAKHEFTFISAIYYSVVTFTTLGGDIFPNSPTATILTIAEVLLGYIMLGGLISIFAGKLARRGS